MGLGGGMPGGGPGGRTGGASARGARGGRSGTRSTSTAPVVAEAVPGFVVIVEGSTPHESGLQFLSPHEAGRNRGEWGFFQQLRYLGKTDADIERDEQESARLGTVQPVGGGAASSSGSQRVSAGRSGSARAKVRSRPAGKPVRSGASGQAKVLTDAEKVAVALPFAAYIRPGEAGEEYFDDSEGDWVSSGQRSEQPEGLGIVRDTESRGVSRAGAGARPRTSDRDRSGQTRVLVDAFTLEPVSDTYALDAEGEPLVDRAGNAIIDHHDYWFRLKFKVRLKQSGAK